MTEFCICSKLSDSLEDERYLFGWVLRLPLFSYSRITRIEPGIPHGYELQSSHPFSPALRMNSYSIPLLTPSMGRFMFQSTIPVYLSSTANPDVNSHCISYDCLLSDATLALCGKSVQNYVIGTDPNFYFTPKSDGDASAHPALRHI